MIDLHCHLDLYPDPAAVAAECERRKLYVLSVTTTPTAFEGTSKLAHPEGRVRTALGLHPELAAARAHELPIFEMLLPQTAYVGEIGLDGSPPHRDSLPAQRGVFVDILSLCARAGGRKLSIHSRGATGEVLDALEAFEGAGTPILHWYVGSARQVERANALGAWFSVGPSMLGSERGRRAASAMPRDRILPESDGPFGEIDGKPAAPWDAWRAVPLLALMWDVSPQAASEQLISNFRNFSSL